MLIRTTPCCMEERERTKNFGAVRICKICSHSGLQKCTFGNGKREKTGREREKKKKKTIPETIPRCGVSFLFMFFFTKKECEDGRERGRELNLKVQYILDSQCWMCVSLSLSLPLTGVFIVLLVCLGKAFVIVVRVPEVWGRGREGGRKREKTEGNDIYIFWIIEHQPIEK